MTQPLPLVTAHHRAGVSEPRPAATKAGQAWSASAITRGTEADGGAVQGDRPTQPVANALLAMRWIATRRLFRRMPSASIQIALKPK
jgi:hypothetical protein